MVLGICKPRMMCQSLKSHASLLKKLELESYIFKSNYIDRHTESSLKVQISFCFY